MIHSLWTTASYLLPFALVLGVVVLVHELGHFLVGRWCGIRVEAFSLGFGRELWAYTDKHGTRWRIGALPLGGYVKFFGDADAASATDVSAAATMTEAERAQSFFAQPLWKRAATVAAGPFANFALAIVLFAGIFTLAGRPILAPRIDNVVVGSPAEAAGFKRGDLVLSIDGVAVESFSDMQRIVSAAADRPLAFVVARENDHVALTATPRAQDIVTPFGTAHGGMLGVSAAGGRENWRVRRYGPVEAVGEAFRETWFVIDRSGAYLGGLFIGRESTGQLSGPIRIAEVSGEVAKAGAAPLINLIAVVSISIGLLNLLPVPLLDGGHLLYYALEALRGRALPPRAQEFGFKIGLAFVATLMVIATYNDLSRLARAWFNPG